jgi:predicted transcriptional regulator
MTEGKEIKIRKLFGLFIKNIIKTNGLIKSDIFEAAGITRHQLNDLIYGNRNQTGRTYIRVLYVLRDYYNENDIIDFVNYIKKL